MAFGTVNYNYYGTLSDFQFPGQRLWCEADEFNRSGLNTSNLVIPFGRFLASTANVQSTYGKKASAGVNVPAVSLPGSGTTLPQIIGVSLYHHMGMYESDAQWYKKDIYSTGTSTNFTGYFPQEMVTWTDRSRAIWINVSSAAGATVGSPVSIDVSGSFTSGSIVSSGGLLLPNTKALRAPIIFASDARLSALNNPAQGALGVQLVEVKLF